MLSFQIIDANNLDDILDLDVAEDQRDFVASNERSLAQALIYQNIAWYRALYHDGVAVGFVMLNVEDRQKPFLWRMMIGALHQRKGFGTAALALLTTDLKAKNVSALSTSCVTDARGPLPFYLANGFTETGVIDEDGEVVLVRNLS